jgi:Zn-dependent protease
MSFPSLFEILSIWITFVISISLHEYAHAYASNYFWDPTPRLQWRLTPNPLVHIDPLGFVLIFLINFGRWRPVQIDPSYYRHRLRDELIVALAWPAVNILLGSIAALIVLVIIKLQWPLWLYTGENILIQFRYLFGRINMGLAVFNMIPLPPLDGYRVIKYLFPKAWYRLEANGRILGIILLAAILLPTPAQYYLQSLIVWGAQMLYGLAQMFWWVVLWWI